MKKKRFDEHCFDVTIPTSASQILGICCGCIFVLFIIFTVMFLFEFGGVTKGNLYVCIVIEIIFSLLILQFKTWRLTIRDDEICVNGIYRKKRVFSFKEISKVIIGKKYELEIYVCDKKVTTIDRTCTYYDELIEVLKNKGCDIKERQYKGNT